MLADYKREFVEFAIAEGALNFGSFELKSGRTSPYFFNAGEFKSGRALQSIGDYFAAALVDSGIHVDCLFGPAFARGLGAWRTLTPATRGREGLAHGYELKWHSRG